ncbi:hypothetical protein EVAR_102631_1 [Eumeta japonica]|uniref:Uncharacterized protein n=1 Tax=Eumeta variegata TaxID=151549 RepID=A0A4C1TUS4_EUMVA|nr:hypothetical protein EVAR_102631_1 [Eumeta japonica]
MKFHATFQLTTSRLTIRPCSSVSANKRPLLETSLPARSPRRSVCATRNSRWPVTLTRSQVRSEEAVQSVVVARGPIFPGG